MSLNTFGGALRAGEGLDDLRETMLQNRMRSEEMKHQLRLNKDYEDIIKAAGAEMHRRMQSKPAAPAQAANASEAQPGPAVGTSTMPGRSAGPGGPLLPGVVAGGGGVMMANGGPVGPSTSPVMGTPLPGYANGGPVNGREGKFDGIFDAQKWDGTIEGLPTAHHMQLHHITGVNPAEGNFLDNLKAMKHHAKYFSNGGMSGAAPGGTGSLYPGFADGGVAGMVSGLHGFHQKEADRQSTIPGGGALAAPAPAPSLPAVQGGGPGYSKPNPGRIVPGSPEWEAKMREMDRNRPVRKSDGGIASAIALPAADGGAIGMQRGPGTGTSDSIPARLSDGEFVIPADVVHAKGTHFFQKLIDKFHTQVG
jgi:hypothetical protein